MPFFVQAKHAKNRTSAWCLILHAGCVREKCFKMDLFMAGSNPTSSASQPEKKRKRALGYFTTLQDQNVSELPCWRIFVAKKKWMKTNLQQKHSAKNPLPETEGSDTGSSQVEP